MTDTGKTRLVSRAGSGLTLLVGGVVSISHEVESALVPAIAVRVVDAAALTVSV